MLCVKTGLTIAEDVRKILETSLYINENKELTYNSQATGNIQLKQVQLSRYPAGQGADLIFECGTSKAKEVHFCFLVPTISKPMQLATRRLFSL